MKLTKAEIESHMARSSSTAQEHTHYSFQVRLYISCDPELHEFTKSRQHPRQLDFWRNEFTPKMVPCLTQYIPGIPDLLVAIYLTKWNKSE